MSQHQRRIFDIVYRGDVLEPVRRLSNENGADGNRVGNRVLDGANFQQSGICIRYAAILSVHDLEARAIHLR